MSDGVLKDAGLVQKEFDGKNYAVMLLDADKGWDVGMGVFKLLSTPIARAYDSGALGEDIRDYDFASNISMALTSMLDRVDVKDLMKQLLSTLTVDGEAVDFNIYFRGRYAHLLSVTIWAFRENFSDFPGGFQVEGQEGVSEILTSLLSAQKVPQEESKEQ